MNNVVIINIDIISNNIVVIIIIVITVTIPLLRTASALARKKMFFPKNLPGTLISRR